MRSPLIKVTGRPPLAGVLQHEIFLLLKSVPLLASTGTEWYYKLAVFPTKLITKPLIGGFLSNESFPPLKDVRRQHYLELSGALMELPANSKAAKTDAVQGE